MTISRFWIRFVVVFLVIVSGASAQQYSAWTTAQHVAGQVNIAYAQTDPFISKDALSLFFTCSNCPGGYGGADIYVARRGSTNEAWGPPENLGPMINTSYDETRPVLSLDGHRLYFASTQPGGIGLADIYISRRRDKRNDFAWRLPENLGEGVNSAGNETPGSMFEDEATGVITFYFQSDRLGAPGDDDIFTSIMLPDGTFASPNLVSELSTSSAYDRHPVVRRDGLEIVFTSNRPGSILNLKGQPSYDLWTSTRSSSVEPWSTPVNLDADGSLSLNTGKHEGGPALSFDGMTLYFHAAQRVGNVSPGCPDKATCNFDIWMSTRTKLPADDAGVSSATN